MNKNSHIFRKYKPHDFHKTRSIVCLTWTALAYWFCLLFPPIRKLDDVSVGGMKSQLDDHDGVHEHRNQPCSTKVMDLKRFFHPVTFVCALHTCFATWRYEQRFSKAGRNFILHLSSLLFAKYVSSRGYPYIWGHGQPVTRHCSTNEKVRLCLSRYNNNNNI